MELTSKEIEKEVLDIVSEYSREGVPVALESLLRDDLWLDSLDMVEICIEAEKRFGIYLGDCYPDDFRTVSDLVHGVEKYLNGKEEAK